MAKRLSIQLPITAITVATLLIGLSLTVTDSAAQSPPAKAPPADAPKPASDGTEYQAVKYRDLLTYDFVLEHPDGKSPEGVTTDEAKLIEETLSAGVRALFTMQDKDGVIDLFAPRNGKGRGPQVSGTHGLALWTMMAAGAKPSSPGVKSAVKALLDLVAQGMGGDVERRKSDGTGPKGAAALDTYELSIVMMAMHALAVERVAEADAAKPAANKSPTPKGPPDKTALSAKRAANELKNQLTKPELACVKEVYDALLARQAADGGWGYRIGDKATDPSNSHFALLGLLSGFRVGQGVPDQAVLDRAKTYWINAQGKKGPQVTLTFKDIETAKGNKKPSTIQRQLKVTTTGRGWGYSSRPTERLRLSMTAAGVVSLAVVRHLMLEGAGSGRGDERLASLDAALTDGLAGLVHMLPETNSEGVVKPEAPTGPTANPIDIGYTEYPNKVGYAMLAVERAGILAGCDTFGKCEWYPAGARSVLKNLEPLRAWAASGGNKPADGGKAGGEPVDLIRLVSSDACLELLFLKGYLDKTPRGPVITRSGKKPEAPPTPPAPTPPSGDPKPADAPKPAGSE